MLNLLIKWPFRYRDFFFGVIIIAAETESAAVFANEDPFPCGQHGAVHRIPTAILASLCPLMVVGFAEIDDFHTDVIKSHPILCLFHLEEVQFGHIPRQAFCAPRTCVAFHIRRLPDVSNNGNPDLNPLS